MKFSCKKNDIVQALQIVMKAVSVKPKTPVLSGIYIKAEDNKLTLKATDYELSIICNIDAQVETGGELVLGGRYTQDIIRRLPGDTVDFEYAPGENQIHIKSNRSKFSLLSMSANDYPEVEPIEYVHELKLSDAALRKLIIHSSFACLNDESRPIFTGALLEIRNGNITMVATNTHRLALCTEGLEQEEEDNAVVIPAKLLNELQKILQSEMPRDVLIRCSRNQISFQLDNIYIASRLIEGSFPDYHRAIPMDFKSNIVMQTEEVKGIIERLALISRTNEFNVISMDFANGMVRITSANPEIGNGEEFASAVIHGQDMQISFNADYIYDGLKLIQSQEFTLSLNGPSSAAAFRTESEPGFTYIVTPVKRQGGM